MAEDDPSRKPYGLPGTVSFYTNSEELERIRDSVSQKLNFDPQRFPDPTREAVHRLVETSGAAAIMAATNPKLVDAISDFLTGKKPFAIIAGHSGNGKSLLATELRRLHQIYSTLDPSLQSPIVAISFDRARSNAYTALREEINEDPDQPLPKIQPQHRLLNLISGNLLHLVKYAMTEHPNTRIVLETPLYANRGENVLNYLRTCTSQYPHVPYTVFPVNSQDMVNIILGEGKRVVETSAAPEVMLKNQRLMLDMTVGDLQVTDAQKYDIFAKYFAIKLAPHEGEIIRWSPYSDFSKFEQTRAEFIAHAASSDDLSPKGLENASRAYFNTRLATLSEQDLEKLLKEAFFGLVTN